MKKIFYSVIIKNYKLNSRNLHMFAHPKIIIHLKIEIIDSHQKEISSSEIICTCPEIF